MASKKEEAKAAIKRTNDIMKACQELEKFKRQITAIQDELEKPAFHCQSEEIINIGQKIQHVCGMIKHHSIEGQIKKRGAQETRKFRKHVGVNVDDKKWLIKNCKLYVYDKKHPAAARCSLLTKWAPKAWELNTTDQFYVTVEPTAFWVKNNRSK
jgi:hypothetical protein